MSCILRSRKFTKNSPGFFAIANQNIIETFPEFISSRSNFGDKLLNRRDKMLNIYAHTQKSIAGKNRGPTAIITQTCLNKITHYINLANIVVYLAD